MRQALVNKIDPQKAIDFFKRTQGWSEEEVRAGTHPAGRIQLTRHYARSNSIMCYQIPGELTKDGNPIIGGKDIDTSILGLLR